MYTTDRCGLNSSLEDISCQSITPRDTILRRLQLLQLCRSLSPKLTMSSIAASVSLTHLPARGHSRQSTNCAVTIGGCLSYLGWTLFNIPCLDVFFRCVCSFGLLRPVKLHSRPSCAVLSLVTYKGCILLPYLILVIVTLRISSSSSLSTASPAGCSSSSRRFRPCTCLRFRRPTSSLSFPAESLKSCAILNL